MLQMLVVADDFTGALDTGVQFAKQGFATQVVSGPPDFSRADMADVLVADAQSRHLEPERAYGAVYAWVREACARGVPLLYKKTDSTLRGNVGAEICAAMDASARDVAIFPPAFPRLGRTVKQGIAYVKGVPLDQTDFARDPFNPVHSSAVAEILGEQTQAPVVLAEDGASLAALAEGEGQRIICLDASREEELAAIARAARPLRDRTVLAGCAGFAEFLPDWLQRRAENAPPASRAENMLVVCGSVNAVSLAQTAAAERAGIPSICLTPRQCVEEGVWTTAEGQEVLARLVGLLQGERCVVVKTACCQEDVEKTRQYALEKGIDPDRVHLRIASGLGSLVQQVTLRQRVDAVTVFGGDTLFGIVGQLGARGIAPKREILPGLVQSELSTPEGGKMVFSKAGGFGEEDVIERLWEKVKA